MTRTPIEVFIVDDHPFVREWLANLLGLERDIEVVGDAEEPVAAMAAMVVHPPSVAVVDLSLKRGSGIELIHTIRARLPETRVVVLSMHDEIADVERALRAGASGYVMKGEATDQIVTAIREVAAGNVYAAPSTLAQLAGTLLGRAQNADSGNTISLSDRELEVFRRIGNGHSTRRIAEDLGVAHKTVQTYCARIKEKLGLADHTALIRTAIRLAKRDGG